MKSYYIKIYTFFFKLTQVKSPVRALCSDRPKSICYSCRIMVNNRYNRYQNSQQTAYKEPQRLIQQETCRLPRWRAQYCVLHHPCAVISDTNLQLKTLLFCHHIWPPDSYIQNFHTILLCLSFCGGDYRGKRAA